MMTKTKKVVNTIVPYVPAAAALALPKLNKSMDVAHGAIQIIKGVRYAYDAGRGIWNKVRRQKVGNGALVSHPGALPGAIAAPVATTRIIRGSKPKFLKSKGSVVLSHREYVTQVSAVSSGILQLNNGAAADYYRVNPTNVALTPWLINIASNFDQYRFVNVELQYVPLCATTEVGRVAVFFDKDSADPGPFDRAELANYAHLTETSAWCEARLQVPVDNVKRFVNDSSVTDTKLVDLGRVGLCTYGTNTNNQLGDLFIKYTVELFEAQPSSDIVAEGLGTAGAITSTRGSNLFSYIQASSSATVASFSFKPGTYMVTFLCDATAATGASVTVVTGGAVLSFKTAFITTKATITAIIDMSAPNNRIDFSVPSTSMQGWNLFAARTTRVLNISITNN